MPATLEPPVFDPLSFHAQDVTGMLELEFDSWDGHRPVKDTAMAVAESMDLDLSVPYGLRDDRRARLLRDDAPLGAEIRPGAKLVVIPKSHLG